ncbi:hypothetical protein Sste5346_007279 [Sporothrix stenoceras]|uniref:Uncharacterized protein n=1 Tax=Sporothrix stenoceras TaxID=5173 RepID=A0ABR3YV60_9PEZI
MSHQHPNQPLGKSADNIYVNGEKFDMVTKTKAAVREKLTVDDMGRIVEEDYEHDENRPQAQGDAPISLVSGTQPIKRQKSGFEATPTHPTSYVAMPMKSKGITSGPPRAPLPTSIVTKSTTVVDDKQIKVADQALITTAPVPTVTPTIPVRRNKTGVLLNEALPLRGGAPLPRKSNDGASIHAHDGAASDDDDDLDDRDDRRYGRGLSESPHFSTGASMILEKTDCADRENDDDEDEDWCFVSGGQSPTSSTTPKITPPLRAKLAKIFRN